MMDIKMKALLVIEALAGGDFAWNDVEKMKNDIYKYAHIASGHCPNPHADWVRELNITYEFMNGIMFNGENYEE